MKRHYMLTAIASIMLVFTAANAAAQDQAASKKAAQSAKPETKQVKDPVCGMMINPKTAAGTSKYKGKTYYFCSREDKEKFDKAPEQYVKPERN